MKKLKKKIAPKKPLDSARGKSSKAPVKSVKATEPQTMEELLAQSGQKFRGWKVGDMVEGIITEKTNRAIYVDIGGKTEGMVIDREMKAARDFIKALAVGDKVTAIITQPENDRGQTLMSFKRAAANQVWNEFETKLKTQETMKVRGKEVNKGGLIIEVKGVQGFIPSSCFSAQYTGKIEDLIEKDLEAKVIEVDRQQNRLIFSEREVSEAGLIKAQEEILKTVKVGDVFEGKVTGVMPFGLFVKVTMDKKKTKKEKDAGPITLEGLVHISEISWEKVEDPSKFFKQGDKVKVKVLAIDRKSGKLNLSIKQLIADPWDSLGEKYQQDKKVKGVVARLAPFGAFISLEPGIEGLIHISKIPAEQTINPGDKVNCYIESLDKEHRRMSLGLVLKEKPVGYK